MDLPAGTVTFLITAVESSTRMLQARLRAYAVAIARHHELLDAAVEQAGGVVFETVGDAVYAAFSDPVAAVSAAVEGQRALQAEPWPGIGALRVRMGLHTGPSRCGVSTNSVMSAAHGGQVVLFTRLGIIVQAPDRADMHRDVSGARELISADAFSEAWEVGTAMELEDAVRYATERVGRTE